MVFKVTHCPTLSQKHSPEYDPLWGYVGSIYVQHIRKGAGGKFVYSM